MVIGGFQKHSLSDYPGKIACVVFFSNCNFRCPWCHNGSLVKRETKIFSQSHILNEIKQIRKWIDGVVISGGEPTLSPELFSFCEQLRSLNLLIKLDTNGSRPEIIKKLIESRLIDFIAMDIKTDLKNYKDAIGTEYDTNHISESIQLIISSSIDYEFRSTVVPDFFTEETLLEILKTLKDAKTYVLQQYNPLNRLDISKCVNKYPNVVLETWLELSKKYIKDSKLRAN